MRKRLDESLAEAAAAANIPFVLSGASIAPIETISRVGSRHTWAHLYSAKDATIT
jgi:isopentenyl diphosphate isomerase/L-lactate dehydrogenase-like FMN-dependent dehydrogenase